MELIRTDSISKVDLFLRSLPPSTEVLVYRDNDVYYVLGISENGIFYFDQPMKLHKSNTIFIGVSGCFNIEQKQADKGI
jgi:hypothetical protein